MTLTFPEIQTKKDIRLLSETASEIWREYFPGIISDRQIEYMIGKFQSYDAMHAQISTGGYRYFFVRGDDIVLGYICVREEEKKLFISKLYLKKQYRGKGYFRSMLSFCESIAREKGLASMYLTVNRGNEHAISVYTAKGFLTVREQKADIGAGFVMDDYVMEKKLV